MYSNLAVLALFACAYSVVASRLARTPVSGPILFLAFGALAGPAGIGLLDLQVEEEGIGLIAEFTLALVLFCDAANADLGELRRTVRLPRRMLLIGLPLTILLGFGAARLVFPELGLVGAALLATMLAPTDAALGKAVVSNPVVPSDVREGLNAESGLNDGICVPILFTFLALAAETGVEGGTTALALELVAQQIGIGAVVGVGLAVAGALALRTVFQRGWIEEPWVRAPVVMLAFGSFALAQHVGGSGFIACFVGGLVFGSMARKHKHEVLAGAEALGEIFALLTWVAFGEIAAQRLVDGFDGRSVVYALLSLTVLRMLPIYLSVLGQGLSTEGKLFLGWFGPRGLASIVFAVIVVHHHVPGSGILVSTTAIAVVLSVVLHGVSANPWAAGFGARAKVG